MKIIRCYYVKVSHYNEKKCLALMLKDHFKRTTLPNRSMLGGNIGYSWTLVPVLSASKGILESQLSVQSF